MDEGSAPHVCRLPHAIRLNWRWRKLALDTLLPWGKLLAANATGVVNARSPQPMQGGKRDKRRIVHIGQAS